MSDRDDIDVIGNAENKAESSSANDKKADNNSSNSSSNNQAIRQNPLTHSDEKPVGKGFLEKLKRAFSTEDGGESYEDDSDGGLVEDSDGIGGFMNIFKRNKTSLSETAENKTEEKSASDKTSDSTDTNITEKSNAPEDKTGTQNSHTEENSEEFDPEEEEEFKMISAFLEGEEYISPIIAENAKAEGVEVKIEEKTENVEVKVEEKTESVEVKTEQKTESKNDEVKVGDKADSQDGGEVTEYDSQNAFENEEADFDVRGAFDSEDAEFIMIDIDDEEEFSDDFDSILEDEFKKENSEEKTEEKSEEVTSEEKSEEKTEKVVSEEKTEEKTEEVVSEEKSEEKFEEVTSEEKTEEKTEEVTSEEKTEEKIEEVVSKEKSEEKIEEVVSKEKSEEKSEEVTSEEKTEEKSEEVISEKKTEDKSEEIVPREKTEEKTKAVISEEKTEEKTKAVISEEKTEEKTKAVISEEKTEEKSEEVISKEKNNKNSDGIQVESINAEGGKPEFDELDDDDEEFRFEEDFVFDESDDEEDDEFENLTIPEDIDDLDGLFNTTQNPKDKPEPYEIPEDKKEDKPEVSADNSDKSENNVIPEPKENSEPIKEVKAEEKSEEKAKENTEEKSKTADKPEEISAPENQNGKSNKVKKKADSPFGKIKSAFSKGKNKLVEMWNTKEDGTVSTKEKTPETDTKAVTEVISDKKENVVDTPPVTEEKDKYGVVFESDSENTDINVSENDTSEVVDISESITSDDKDTQPKIIPMKVIKNENAEVVPIDRQKVRESISVIEKDKTVSEPDILTDEQKHQLEMNQKVLEKVKQYEEEVAEKREEREEQRKARAERSAKAYEKAFGTTDRITEIEINNYQDFEPEEIIKVKAGKFTESVRSEYEFYIGYTRLKNVAKSQTKVEPAKQRTETRTSQSKTSQTEKSGVDQISYAEFSEDKFAKSRDRLDSISKRLDYKDLKNPESLEYRTEDDAVKIKKILQEKLKQAKMQWNVSVGLTFAMFILCCIGGLFTVGGGETAKDGSLRGFAFVNLAIYAAMLYNCRDIIARGLHPLTKLKSNSDTGYAVAAVVTALQSVVALITPTPFFRQGLNVYTLVVMLALAVNSLGKQRNADRISSNFRFVSDSSQKYTGKFFHDQRMVATLLSGTRNDKSELVFQKKTSFLKHFIKLSNSPDPGEELADKFSLPTIVFSLIISIVYLFLSKSFADSVSVLSIMLCAAVPMCSKALGAVPLHKLAKNSLANQSMVVGYQAVESFSESAAVMLDAKELYPEGSVHLNGIKTFDTRRIDDAMLAAASVIITAGGAMAGMFDGIIQGDKQENLPTAENVIYEDGKGLIGWVNNERIFIGNRKLLRSHDIEPMSKQYEEEQKADGDEILYLACAGELVAMFIVGYSANRRVADALRRMEANGMSMLIRTTDVNITAERIAKDFGVSHRSIKILEQKNSNVVRDEMIGKEKSSPAFVATKGGVTSFGRAVSGCIQTKRNISLSLAVQVFGVLLGLLIVTVIALVSGVHHIGAMQMFFFYLFWVAAVLAAPPIIQKFLKT